MFRRSFFFFSDKEFIFFCFSCHFSDEELRAAAPGDGNPDEREVDDEHESTRIRYASAVIDACGDGVNSPNNDGVILDNINRLFPGRNAPPSAAPPVQPGPAYCEPTTAATAAPTARERADGIIIRASTDLVRDADNDVT